MGFRSLYDSGRHRTAGAALLFGMLAAPLGLAAEPLDKEACGKLQAERASLIVLGVDKEFAKGADWAKANLPQPELDQLKRYLTIDEQLKFRCGLAMVTLQVPDEPEDGEEDDNAPAAHSVVPVPHKRDQAAAVKPAAKPATAPAKTQPAAVKPAAPGKPAPKGAAAKAQSSWNTQTAPLEQVAPETASTGAAPKSDRRNSQGD
jgi:hypothetical protein